jgi:CheY-like chemotaxis protein
LKEQANTLPQNHDFPILTAGMETSKRTVFLIDDDNIYQYTAKILLESTGMARNIHSFYNGKEALSYFQTPENQKEENLPDVIFLDINMPVMNGWEFLEEYDTLRKVLPKHIALYVVSSSVDSSDMEKSRSYLAVTDYLIKPVNRNQYREVMERL